MSASFAYPAPSWQSPRTVAFSVYSPSALSGTTSLVWAVPVSSGQVAVRGRCIRLNPGASRRVLKMPPVSGATGAQLVLRNVATNKVCILALQDSTGTPLGLYIEPGCSMKLECDGTTWFAVGSTRRERDSAVRTYQYDFHGKAGDTLPGEWATQDTSAAGTPTLAYISAGVGGQFDMKLDTTNEVEAVTLSFDDATTINAQKLLYAEWRCSITLDSTGATALPAAGDKIVIGLGSARNATLDSMTRNAWFLIGGQGTPDAVIRCESDDNTTDVDDTSSGVTLTPGAMTTFGIDFTESDSAGVRFYINGTLVATTASIVWTSGVLQPFLEVAKAAAANFDHRVIVDYFRMDYLQ